MTRKMCHMPGQKQPIYDEYDTWIHFLWSKRRPLLDGPTEVWSLDSSEIDTKSRRFGRNSGYVAVNYFSLDFEER